MKEFSDLLESLLFSPRRKVKLAHLVNWIKSSDDPDRGWGLAALTADLSFSAVKAGAVRELAEQVTDLNYSRYHMIGTLPKQWPYFGLT